MTTSWRTLRGYRGRRLVALGRSGYAFVRGRRVVPPSALGGRERALTSSQYVTPLVRKLASEHQVDVGVLRGTGVGGRIRAVDVEAVVAERTALFPRAAALVCLAVDVPFDEAALMLEVLSAEARDELLLAALELQAMTLVALSLRSSDPSRVRQAYRGIVFKAAADLEASRG